MPCVRFCVLGHNRGTEGRRYVPRQTVGGTWGGLAGLWHLVEQQARNISALGNKYAGMQGLPPAVGLAWSLCP